MSDETYRFLLRMPAALRDSLRESAASSGRSLNGEIVARLEGGFEPSRSAGTRVSALVAAATLSVSVLGAAAVGSAVGVGTVVALHGSKAPAASSTLAPGPGLKRVLLGEPASGS